MPTHTATLSDIQLIKSDVRLIGLPAEDAAKRVLPGSADEVLKTIASMMREMVRDVISTRTRAEFDSHFTAVFPGYFNLVMAFSKVASMALKKDQVIRMSRESFSELEADIRDNGVSAFGEHLTERAMFTVWTLRKISDLLMEMDQSGKSTVQDAQDQKLAEEYFLHAMVARFHVDCLIGFMRTKLPFYPDVEPAIDNGLRSAVNAYACIKQAVDARFPSNEDDPLDLPWSVEQQELLDASVRDLDDSPPE